MRRVFIGLAFVAGWVSTANADALGDAVAKVKADTARYQDVNNALADGYIPDPVGGCVSAAKIGLPAELGAMGVHYLNPALLGLSPPGERVDGNGTNLDFSTPSILLYEPQADGSMQLVGVENLVFKASWDSANKGTLPSFANVDYEAMSDNMATPGDEAHGFAPHYDLHIWTERANPAGMTTPFNPAVACTS